LGFITVFSARVAYEISPNPEEAFSKPGGSLFKEKGKENPRIGKENPRFFRAYPVDADTHQG